MNKIRVNDTSTQYSNMLQKKNALMRSGKVEQAAALSKKIGEAIKQKYKTSEYGNVDNASCLTPKRQLYWMQYDNH